MHTKLIVNNNIFPSRFLYNRWKQISYYMDWKKIYSMHVDKVRVTLLLVFRLLPSRALIISNNIFLFKAQLKIYVNTALLFSITVAAVVNMLKSNRQFLEYVPLYSSYLWSLCRLRRCWPAQPESRPDAASQTRPATCSSCNINILYGGYRSHTPSLIQSQISTSIQRRKRTENICKAHTL